MKQKKMSNVKKNSAHLLRHRRFFRRKFLDLFWFMFIGTVAILFLMPLILTVCDSFMTETEIFYNYGVMLDLSSDTVYTADSVTIKFIPDRITAQQYISVLITNSEYLLKLWNSVALTLLLMAFHDTADD